MSNVFDNAVLPNKLMPLLGDFDTNHVGYVYGIDFQKATVLTNDNWKARVAGIPHNSFLIATAINPQSPSSATQFDNELVLLRVVGPARLPSDGELLQTRIEHNQRREANERYPSSETDGFDPMTQSELQYGGLECRILGTFFLDDDGEIRLGSDVENYFASTRLRVYKPRADALERIVNHINSDRRKTMLADAEAAGFKSAPSSIPIGTVRYTSTSRLHRGKDEPKVPVFIQPSDFLARRTAVLGMTRTGKSNTVKTTVASVATAGTRSGIKIGQIIFDLNGEYANANHQDDGSSIAAVFGDNCVRYRAIETPGFLDLRTNFYEQPAEALNLISKLLINDPFRNQTDLQQFLDSGLEEPEATDISNHKRWQQRVAVFQATLCAAGFPVPAGLAVTFPANKDVLEAVKNAGGPLATPVGRGSCTLSPQLAVDFFTTVRSLNYELREQQKTENRPQKGFTNSSGNSWVDPMMESYLNVLARANATGTSIRGFRALIGCMEYHSPKRQGDVVKEVVSHLWAGKIVILDLSAGPVEVRSVLSKRIAQQIFDTSFREYNSGRTPQNIVIYVEEAHNLIGKKEELTTTWPRIAKEGAKAKIAFVYATQEPSSIHPNILANTENWFVTHLNNDDELKALAKFYDFADFIASLKSAQDVGFARIKTLSSPFVIPVQIDRFTPADLEQRLAAIASVAD
ncbi:ATP-binding protein [Achromobacter sp. PD1]|uniref:ATP-binding protein n=1 Tax=Achromobacter sp. PD1 TaxID=3399125 RepID=UPI003AF99119